MSIKVPKESVEYQSHNHCQCDFCSSRRAVNAKKFSISERAAQLQHAKNRNGCCCHCHDAVNATTFAASRNGTNTAFDPEYPAPVNQTALNASRGRNGTPNGQTTTTTTTTTTVKRTKEEEEKDAMDELDRLERLLIMEHKARVNATLEADRLGTLRDAATVSGRGPQPLPVGYNSGFGASDMENPQQTFSGSNYASGSYYNADAQTVREAYELAHQCPVTPPVQCRSSHRLQDTINDVRAVAMDPINPAGREHLEQLLYANGLGATPVASRSALQQQSTRNSVEKEFGSSLAKNRTSHPHPQGAGVVWVNGKQQLTFDASRNGTSLPPGAAAAVAAQQQQADNPVTTTTTTTKTTKTVTYAV